MRNAANNRVLYIIVLLLLTANVVTLVLLWTNRKTDHNSNRLHPQQGNRVFEFLTDELDLDSAQQVIYKNLRDEHRAGVKPLQDSIRNAKDRFFDLLQDKNITDTAIYEYSKKIGDQLQQMDIITFKHFQKLRAICNQQQQEKFDNVIKEVMHSMTGLKRPQGPPTGRPDGEEPGPPPE